MSGVTTGTRLEQLRKLRTRIEQEIAAEERRLALEGMRVFQRPARGRNRVDELLAELGATAGDVKRWALAAGLITEIRRGRVGLQLVEAYAQARRTFE